MITREEDYALDACLDARDAMFKALRLVSACKRFNQEILETLYEAEHRLTAGINIQLEARRREASAQKVAA